MGRRAASPAPHGTDVGPPAEPEKGETRPLLTDPAPVRGEGGSVCSHSQNPTVDAAGPDGGGAGAGIATLQSLSEGAPTPMDTSTARHWPGRTGETGRSGGCPGG